MHVSYGMIESIELREMSRGLKVGLIILVGAFVGFGMLMRGAAGT